VAHVAHGPGLRETGAHCVRRGEGGSGIVDADRARRCADPPARPLRVLRVRVEQRLEVRDGALEVEDAHVGLARWSRAFRYEGSCSSAVEQSSMAAQCAPMRYCERARL